MLKTLKSHSTTLLTIGGLDPSGYAGIIADLRVWHRYGFSTQAIATALTVQNKTQCLSWRATPLRLFQQQVEACLPYCDGIKIGMIASPQHAQVLAQSLEKHPQKKCIWDPVKDASSGTSLFRAASFGKEMLQLLQQVDGFTPNQPEAQWILKKTSFRSQSLKKTDFQVEALHQLFKTSSRKPWILLKGGHGSNPKQTEDIFFDGKNLQILKAKRLLQNPRGTGCTLAAAILAALMIGQDTLPAIRWARQTMKRLLFN